MPDPVFVDTAFLLALYNTRDDYHDAAELWYAISSEKGWRYVTSYFCILELYDWCADPRNRDLPPKIHSDLELNPRARIVSVSQDLLESGIEHYENRPDQDWELTDCTSFVLMDELGLYRVLTFDDDFTAAGFLALPLQSPSP